MPRSGPRAGDTRSSTGIVTASTPGKRQSCRPRMQNPFRGRGDGLVEGGGLQRPRPGAEASFERHRRLAGVTDRAPDLFEVARGEVVALLQVDAPFGRSTGDIGRDRPEFVG